MSRRRHRVAALVAALLGAIAAPPAVQSAPASAADGVATVNSTRITFDRFAEAVEAVGAVEGVGAGDFAEGERARVVLGDLIVNVVLREFLTANGVEPARSASAVAARDFGIDNAIRQAYQAQLAGLTVAPVEPSPEQYDENPTAYGVLCLRLLLVADEDAANDAVDALRSGAAEDVDAAFDVAGGRADVQCLSLTDMGELAPTVLASVSDAGSGQVLGPLSAGSGFQVIEVPSFDEVSTTLQEYLDDPPPSAAGAPTSTAQLLFDGRLFDADVTVNPRYGRWDRLTATVVPLGQG